MEFFTRSDFDFFSSLRDKTYDKYDPVHVRNGRVLLATVYDKTEFWAKLLTENGFEYQFSRKWQTSGYYRSYTWAKIYPQGIKDPKIFFTIGVGSRFTDRGDFVNTLEYKLDCQRTTKAALDPSMVYEFDKYVGENCIEASRVMIEINEVEQIDWGELLQRTIDFMSFYYNDYLKLLQLTTLNNKNLAKKIIRLCWNNEGWTKPSGAAGKSKASDHAFEKDKGYGYEEWLFNNEMQIDGYRYGFIQAFNKGDHQGQHYEVSAYAIHNQKHLNTYYWIAKINVIEVLTDGQQKQILKEYKKRGWLDTMIGQLSDVGIPGFDYAPINEGKIFNVRYKLDSSNWVKYEEPILIEDPVIEIGKNKHYVALPKKGLISVDELPVGSFTFKEGHTPGNTGKITGKRKKLDFLMQLKHKEIQEKIYNQLSKSSKGTLRKVGTENRTGFGKSVDIVVSCPEEGIIFYEIKTSGSALQCIREAIGQLFEYSYYTNNHFAQKLIVVGLSKASKPVQQYLEYLKVKLGISLCYQFFDSTKNLLMDK